MSILWLCSTSVVILLSLLSMLYHVMFLTIIINTIWTGKQSFYIFWLKCTWNKNCNLYLFLWTILLCILKFFSALDENTYIILFSVHMNWIMMGFQKSTAWDELIEYALSWLWEEKKLYLLKAQISMLDNRIIEWRTDFLD